MMMTRYLIEAPTDEVISLDLVKSHLRVTGSDKDELIQVMIDAAVQTLDPAGDGWLGRALRPQTWEVRCDGFPYRYTGDGYHRNFRTLHAGAIELPYPPLLSVESVKYDDGSGVEQSLAENTGYRVFGVGAKHKAYIAPVPNGTWPSGARCDFESVRVRFRAGYAKPEAGSEDTDTLPAAVKQSILLTTSNLWSLAERSLFLAEEDVTGVMVRRWVVSDAPAKIIAAAAENLLTGLRVFD